MAVLVKSLTGCVYKIRDGRASDSPVKSVGGEYVRFEFAPLECAEIEIKPIVVMDARPAVVAVDERPVVLSEKPIVVEAPKPIKRKPHKKK